MKEVRPSDIEGLPISQRKFEAGLVTLVAKGGEEVCVTCFCDRSHWLVTVRGGSRGAILRLVCHNCGRRFELPYVGPVPVP